MESKPWAAMTSEEKYKTMGSWFFGPKGENHALMLKNFTSIVHNVRAGRMQYFPDDPVSITTEMIESEEFNHSAENMSLILNELTEMLGKHSVPFFSPRYAGHMSFDNSLPAVLGYLAAMQYNQNNVTPEASPFTSLIEWSVGQELCAMLGFNSTFNPAPEGEITGWGHITCGGSIANLESMWVARNLKYYPLSLKNAMKPGGPLNYIAGTFVANLCTGQQKNLFSCSTWELLNLTPTEVVDIPGRLTAQYGISDVALGKVLEPYSIQTVGKQSLDADFGITKPPQYLISLANHYSWPKGAAITGIGRENMIELPVDDDARLSIEHLRKELEKHLAEDSHSLYAVTVIVGTTEHGSVDPIDEVLELRREMQAKGLSFMVHADAAWGGYFASKKILGRARLPGGPEYAFSIPLSAYTNRQMLSLKGVDSVTLDPHKSGFNPYPAGGICYRDARFRYLTTWSSPYISVKEGADTSVGIYGVEGSKPGAAPVGVWLSLQVLTLPGYADLLGVAMLTGVKMYCQWATTTLDCPSLVITPFSRLPTERAGEGEAAIRAQRILIRDTITNRPNYELENDPDAMALVHQLGSDLMINPFACNFHIKEGVINTDVVEASYLNRRLYQRLSITSMNDVLNDKPIVIMATEFSQERYGQALTTFKRRMGLVGNEDLYALSNVSMSPWPTAGQFLETIVSDFKTVAEEEIKNCLVRVVVKPSFHSFVIHGTGENVYLVYMGSFNVSNYKRQMIIEGTLDGAAAHKIRAEQTRKSSVLLTFHTCVDGNLAILEDLLKMGHLVGDIYEGVPMDYGTASISQPLISQVKFNIRETILDRSLFRNDLTSAYPENMPFYVFGPSPTELYMDHLLMRGPNAQLTAGNIRLVLNPSVDPRGKVLMLKGKREGLMVPFTAAHPPAFFASEASFDVGLYNGQEEISNGTVTLGNTIFTDYEWVNHEAATDIYITGTGADGVARSVVKLFGKGDIVWDEDNVVNAINRLCPEARECVVQLGYPGVGERKMTAVVSRFVGLGSGVDVSVKKKDLERGLKNRVELSKKMEQMIFRD